MNFKEFDLIEDLIKPVKNASITLTGKRRSGKSYLLRDIVQKVGKHYKEVYLFSGSYKTDPEFWNFIKKDHQFEGLNETKLNEIWDSQLKMMAKNKGRPKETLPHILLILDDLITDNTTVRNSEFLTKMYSNGRHYNICSILATQSLKRVGKHMRDNSDISIAYPFKNRQDKLDFVEENLTVENSKEGISILDSITNVEPHTCIVVLNYLNGTDSNDKIRRYKVKAKASKESDNLFIDSDNQVESKGFKLERSGIAKHMVEEE